MRIDEKALSEICDHNDVDTLRLFGFFARGEETEESDVDLLVEFGERKSLLDLVRIEREFAEKLGRNVDLLTPQSVSPHLRERIYSQSKVLYRRYDRAG